jgi:NADH-quinone oxidoreductase subunit K
MIPFLITFSNLNILAFFLVIIGICGIIFNYKNIILTLVSIELCLLGINLNFLFSSIFLNDIFGVFFSIMLLTVAAAEAAIGLAILVLFYRVRSSITLNYVNYLRG